MSMAFRMCLTHSHLQTGVVNEALRLSFGLISRPPRIAPEETLMYGEFAIPPGVSSTRDSWGLFERTNPGQ